MPFDALIVPVRPRSLADVLDELGILTVPWAVLETHKQAQLEKYPPGFWYHHQTLLPVGLLGSVGCMAASGGLTRGIAADASLLASAPSLIWMGSFALLIVFGVFRVRAGAYWWERGVAVEDLGRVGVPGDVAATARLLHRDLPGCGLVLGELVQHEVVVDPYLIVMYDDEMACLGIWDDDGVIACAGCDARPRDGDRIAGAFAR
jgi:hypothetical protein